VRNEKVFYSVKKERSITHTMKRGNAVAHILPRNCILKYIIQGKIERRMEVKGRGRRKRKQLPDNLKENIGYWKLKDGALDGSVWRNGFGRGYGPVVR
jgi:hypothetical protein